MQQQSEHCRAGCIRYCKDRSLLIKHVCTKCSAEMFDPPPPFCFSLLHCPSAPCPLAHIVSSINCQANSALVQWDPNGGAESYEVQALGTRGYVTGCNTTGTFCNVYNLLCGDVYTISVAAINNKCSVKGYPVLQLRSGKTALRPKSRCKHVTLEISSITSFCRNCHCINN